MPPRRPLLTVPGRHCRAPEAGPGGPGQGEGGLQYQGLLCLGWPVVRGGFCVGHKAGGGRKWGDGGRGGLLRLWPPPLTPPRETCGRCLYFQLWMRRLSPPHPAFTGAVAG